MHQPKKERSGQNRLIWFGPESGSNSYYERLESPTDRMEATPPTPDQAQVAMHKLLNERLGNLPGISAQDAEQLRKDVEAKIVENPEAQRSAEQLNRGINDVLSKSPAFMIGVKMKVLTMAIAEAKKFQADMSKGIKDQSNLFEAATDRTATSLQTGLDAQVQQIAERVMAFKEAIGANPSTEQAAALQEFEQALAQLRESKVAKVGAGEAMMNTADQLDFKRSAEAFINCTTGIIEVTVVGAVMSLKALAKPATYRNLGNAIKSGMAILSSSIVDNIIDYQEHGQDPQFFAKKFETASRQITEKLSSLSEDFGNLGEAEQARLIGKLVGITLLPNFGPTIAGKVEAAMAGQFAKAAATETGQILSKTAGKIADAAPIQHIDSAMQNQTVKQAVSVLNGAIPAKNRTLKKAQASWNVTNDTVTTAPQPAN